MKAQTPMPDQKTIALVAHDGRKQDLLAWVKFNRSTLGQHRLVATGSTGKLIHDETSLPVQRFMSGPLGGDQQIGASIAEAQIDVLIFFWDPLQPQPHDPDIKALLRLAVLYNVPTASNRATADFLISSPLMAQPYERFIPDYDLRLRKAKEEHDE